MSDLGPACCLQSFYWSGMGKDSTVDMDANCLLFNTDVSTDKALMMQSFPHIILNFS
jgi:hypothetical protein